MSSATSVLRRAASPHSGRVEIAALFALYALYEVVRGFGTENWAAAREHTGNIVALEQHLSVFIERDVQQAASAVAGAPALLGFLYVALHFVGTAVAAVWIHRRAPQAFAHFRTTLIVATGLALVGYVFYPAAPPRLANLGFADTVTTHTGPEPELRPPRQPLQPDRRRAEPPLRLRARRRSRALAPRHPAEPEDRVRALSRADAAA